MLNNQRVADLAVPRVINRGYAATHRAENGRCDRNSLVRPAGLQLARRSPLSESMCDAKRMVKHDETHCQMGMGQNLVPLVNLKIAGKWMFITLKMVLIGIDP